MKTRFKQRFLLTFVRIKNILFFENEKNRFIIGYTWYARQTHF